ncbi:MAG: riboflavin synthase [Acidobacteria bacterium]|nr:riboflavin synthase [Acidobacteriota bacterium]
MFTGLIEAIGRVERSDGTSRGRRLRIATALAADLRPGDSIAVNGVCLTATDVDDAGFCADVSRQTLEVTSLDRLTAGRLVNLERPLRADARLGGHFVLGHVDATGRIAALRPDGDGFWLDIDVPAPLQPYVIPRGSIAVDGISLTIATLTSSAIGIQIVPFTFTHTALQQASRGDVVNLEADVLGKYVARLLSTATPAAAGVLAMEPPR